MKTLILLILSVFLVTRTDAASKSEFTVLARLTQNLGPLQAIELVNVHPIDALGMGDDKLVIRRVSDTKPTVIDMSRFRITIEGLLNRLKQNSSGAIVQKTKGQICLMSLDPTPQLEVSGYSKSSKNATVILTNQSCAFAQRLAPKSEVGEFAAVTLYQLLFDAQ